MPCPRSSANGAPGAGDSDSERRPSSRTRSTTRAGRGDGDRVRGPLAGMRTGHETTKSNSEGGAYWGTGLEPVYLDGALARAVRRTSAPPAAGAGTAAPSALSAEAGVVHLRLETIDPAAPLRLMKTRTL